MNKTYLVVLLLTLLISVKTHGQSLIVGIPSADVAELHHLEVTHESQFGLSNQKLKWNSFNFACYGLKNHLELVLTYNNLSNQSNANPVFGGGFKKVFPILKLGGEKWESKFIFGGNALYSFQRNDFGGWTYAMGSFRIPKTKTRFTGGITYGNEHQFGFRKEWILGAEMYVPQRSFQLMGGFEQPLGHGFSFIGDWISGNHDLACFIPAIQYDFGHNVAIIGYKLPNSGSETGRALILELMFAIPSKKEKPRH